MRAQCALERVENMVNAIKLTHMQQDELNNKLISAAINGDIRKVKESIATGANVDVKDNDGETALHRAALNGHVEVAKVLIEKGADVGAKNNDGALICHSNKLIHIYI